MKRTPKNGATFMGLVVGAEHSAALIKQFLEEKLSRPEDGFGVSVKHVWKPGGTPWDKRELPDGLDFAVVLKDSSTRREERDRLESKLRGTEIAYVYDAPMPPTIAQLLQEKGINSQDKIDWAKPIRTTPDTGAPPTEPPRPEVVIIGKPKAKQPAEETASDRHEYSSAQTAANARNGAIMRRRRNELGISAREVADRIMFGDKPASPAFVHAIEGGKTAATDNMFEAIEMVLGLPPKTFESVTGRTNRRLVMPTAPHPAAAKALRAEAKRAGATTAAAGAAVAEVVAAPGVAPTVKAPTAPVVVTVLGDKPPPGVHRTLSVRPSTPVSATVQANASAAKEQPEREEKLHKEQSVQPEAERAAPEPASEREAAAATLGAHASALAAIFSDAMALQARIESTSAVAVTVVVGKGKLSVTVELHKAGE